MISYRKQGYCILLAAVAYTHNAFGLHWLLSKNTGEKRFPKKSLIRIPKSNLVVVVMAHAFHPST